MGEPMIRDLFSTSPDWSLTIIRIILGVVFFAHGAQKLFGWFGGQGLKETVRTMHDLLKLPLPLASAAVATEFLGGVGLIVGLLSRVAAVGIGVTMLSAIVMVHGRNGLFMDWFGARKNHGYEFHLLAIALVVVLVAKGSGALSLDRVLFNF
jgi:putative oxidoreductase